MPSLNIRIPKNRQNGFVKLLDLDEGSFEELLTALEESAPMVDTGKLISGIAAKTQSISENAVIELLRSVFPLYSFHAESDLSISDFAEEICKVIEETPDTIIDLSGTKWEQLRNRLISLLHVKQISVALKASSLLFQHEHIFQNARIFTDIRPVFEQDPLVPPVAYIIGNMLKIRYYDDGDRGLKEFFVALDTTDIQDLIDVLERAKAKNESLKTVMQDTQLPHINIE